MKTLSLLVFSLIGFGAYAGDASNLHLFSCAFDYSRVSSAVQNTYVTSRRAPLPSEETVVARTNLEAAATVINTSAKALNVSPANLDTVCTIMR